MKNLFLKKTKQNVSTTTLDANFIYIKQTYEHELRRIQDYYSLGTWSIENDNTIVKILKEIRLDRTFPDIDNINYAEEAENTVCKLFHITNPVTTGKKLDIGFFPYQEYNGYMLSLTTNDSLFDVLENPNAYRGLRILDHSLLDFTLKGTDEIENVSEDDIIIAGINIPVLAIQLLVWEREQISLSMDTNIDRFVSSILLPSLIKDIFNCSIVNYINTVVNDTVGYVEENKFSKRYHTNDYRKKLKKSLNRTIKNLDNKSMSYTGFLKSIEVIGDDSLYDFLNLDGLYLTSRNRWLFIMSRVKIMSILRTLGGHRAESKNKLKLSRLRVFMSLLKNDNAMTLFDPFYEETYLKGILR